MFVLPARALAAVIAALSDRRVQRVQFAGDGVDAVSVEVLDWPGGHREPPRGARDSAVARCPSLSLSRERCPAPLRLRSLSCSPGEW